MGQLTLEELLIQSYYIRINTALNDFRHVIITSVRMPAQIHFVFLNLGKHAKKIPSFSTYFPSD